MTSHERHPLPIGPPTGPSPHLWTSHWIVSPSPLPSVLPPITLLTEDAQELPLISNLEGKLTQLPLQVSDLIIEIPNGVSGNLQFVMQLGREF